MKKQSFSWIKGGANLILISWFFIVISELQAQDERCAFVELMKMNYDNGDSMYFEQYNDLISNYLKFEYLQNNSQIYEIPVVFMCYTYPEKVLVKVVTYQIIK